MKQLMRTLTSRLLVFVAMITLLSSAQAVEIYSILTSQCQLHQGLMIHVDEDNMRMLSLSGETLKIKRDQVSFVVIHNTVDNPIKDVTLTPELQSYLRDIYLDDSESPSFRGWPVKFLEGLVIFFDVSGRTHVVDLFQIRKVRPVERVRMRDLNLEGTAARFDVGELSHGCTLPGASSTGITKASLSIRPTRTIADKIQISEFFSVFEKGYQSFYSYQERTYLYAKPFMFEPESKLGVTVLNAGFENPVSGFPLYFQWSQGRPYRFQSFTQLGQVPVESAPSADPFFIARSDLKSHFFHASFVGNLIALPAGTEFYSYSTNFEAIKKAEKETGKAHTAAAFNYIALMGGDWGPWSGSVGTYYPVFLFRIGEEFREVLASSVTPIFRVMFTRRNFQLRALFSRGDRDFGGNINDMQLSVGSEQSVEGLIERYSFNSTLVRVGGEWSINDNIKIGLDQLMQTANYDETTALGDNGSASFTHLVTGASVKHRFGEYVTLGGMVNWYNVKQTFNMGGVNGEESFQKTVLGGSFEFIF